MLRVGIRLIDIFAGSVGRMSFFPLLVHPFLLHLCLQEDFNRQSAIMSVVAENPDIAYVKGGPFAKVGVELPPPGAHVWWKRREKWERPQEGAQLID